MYAFARRAHARTEKNWIKYQNRCCLGSASKAGITSVRMSPKKTTSVFSLFLQNITGFLYPRREGATSGFIWLFSPYPERPYRENVRARNETIKLYDFWYKRSFTGASPNESFEHRLHKKRHRCVNRRLYENNTRFAKAIGGFHLSRFQCSSGAKTTKTFQNDFNRHYIFVVPLITYDKTIPYD